MLQSNQDFCRVESRAFNVERSHLGDVWKELSVFGVRQNEIFGEIVKEHNSFFFPLKELPLPHPPQFVLSQNKRIQSRSVSWKVQKSFTKKGAPAAVIMFRISFSLFTYSVFFSLIMCLLSHTLTVNTKNCYQIFT